MRFGERMGALVMGAILVGCLCATPRQALADEPDITSNPEYIAALAEIDRIANAYSAVAQEQASTLTELENIRGQIADNEAQVAGVEEQIGVKQAELSEMKKTLASHVSSEYKAGSVSLLSIILASDSFEDAISRMYYHNVVCARQADEIDNVNAKRQELQAKQDELKGLKDSLQQQEADLEGLYDEQSSQAAEMQAQQVEASTYLNSLSAELKAALAKEDEELLGSAQAVADDTAQDGAGETGGQGGEAQDAGSTGDANANAGTSGTSGTNGSGTNGSSSGNAGNGSNGNASATNTTNSSGSNANQGTSSSSSSGSSSNANTTTTTTTPKTNGSGSQQAVLNACYSTGGSEALSKGWGCAGWVYCVFRDSGVYNRKPRCAAWYYENWCFSSNRADLKPGMVIAVSTWTGTSAGKIYGHVGIYVGNNTVRHLSAGAVREMSVDAWCKRYGTTVTPMWGWNGGIALS